MEISVAYAAAYGFSLPVDELAELVPDDDAVDEVDVDDDDDDDDAGSIPAGSVAG